MKNRGTQKKERYRIKLVEFLANPENEIVKRSDFSHAILGFKSNSVIYRHFSPKDLDEIEDEAYKLRRQRFLTPVKIRVDQALLKKCEEGDLGAIRLFYERFDDLSQHINIKAEQNIKTDQNIKQGISLETAQHLREEILGIRKK